MCCIGYIVLLYVAIRCDVFCFAVFYHVALWYAVLLYIVLCYNVLFFVLLSCVVLWYGMVCRVELYYVVNLLCSAVLCSVVLFSVVLCSVLLYSIFFMAWNSIFAFFYMIRCCRFHPHSVLKYFNVCDCIYHNIQSECEDEFLRFIVNMCTQSQHLW